MGLVSPSLADRLLVVDDGVDTSSVDPMQDGERLDESLMLADRFYIKWYFRTVSASISLNDSRTRARLQTALINTFEQCQSYHTEMRKRTMKYEIS